MLSVAGDSLGSLRATREATLEPSSEGSSDGSLEGSLEGSRHSDSGVTGRSQYTVHE